MIFGLMDEKKKTLVLDFDGVINSYSSGWTRADDFPDPPTPTAFSSIAIYCKHFTVFIHSSRLSHQDHPERVMRGMKDWLVKHGFTGMIVEGFPELHVKYADVTVFLIAEKPPAFLTIDDRVFLFKGEFPSPEEILEFVPWTKANATDSRGAEGIATVPTERSGSRRSRAKSKA
jgi:hypothetical protein